MMASLGAELASVAFGRVTVTAPVLPGSASSRGSPTAG